VNDTSHSDMNDTSNTAIDLTAEQRAALDTARRLAVAGVPFFIATPKPGSVSGFKLPEEWQRSAPGADSLAAIDRWRPGMALCALGGFICDFLDVDPRNGGEITEAHMRDAGMWPRTFGVQVTPSGGRHYVISPLHVGKYQGKGTLAGLDLQGGRPNGTGRGLLFVAPTVRVSRVDGIERAYAWEVEPDLDELAEWNAVGDDSGGMLAEIVREGLKINDDPRPIATANDPWDSPARLFTPEQAKAFLRPKLEAFKNMTDADTGFNDALNKLACAYSHFIPTYVSREIAERAMFEAARTNGSVEYQGAAAVMATIRSGLNQVTDPWRAELPPDPSQAPAGAVEAAGANAPTATDPVSALMAELLSAEQMAKLPNPVPLVNGVLDMDSLAWFIGAPGSYKSFAALDIAGHVGTGRPWLAHAVKQGRVIYLVAEGTTGMTLRTRAWQTRNGPMTDVSFLPRPVQARGEEWSILVEVVKRVEPALIIIDTQARVTVGINENDNSEVGVFIEQAERLRRASGACVLIVHHTGRNGLDARGASAIDGAQGTELKIVRGSEPLTAEIQMDKQKDMAEAEPLRLTLAVVDGGVDPETGRDLSSLVVESGDPFDPARAAKVKDWIDNLPANQQELMGIVADHFPAIGGTQPQIRAVLIERRKERGAKPMPRGSFHRAWDGLVEKQILLQIGSSQRFALDTLASRTSDGQPIDPTDGS
jgi:hypothetical protein